MCRTILISRSRAFRGMEALREHCVQKEMSLAGSIMPESEAVPLL